MAGAVDDSTINIDVAIIVIIIIIKWQYVSYRSKLNRRKRTGQVNLFSSTQVGDEPIAPLPVHISKSNFFFHGWYGCD